LVRDTGIAAAISAAATAQATADSKIETFYQTTMPSGTIGDLWFDTDDGNKLYRHNGTTFVVAQDAGIGAAITAAAGAQATADGKVTTFFQASTPTASAVGDLWIDTDDANKLYRWSGTAWELARDTGIAAAIASAASAQATADSKILTFYQTTMPTGTIGDLWFDTDDGNKLYRHNGTTFVAAQDAGIGLAITAAAGAQATADGKVTTFYQDAAPTAEAVGDLWIDTNDDNKLYRWDGSAWQSARDAGIAAALAAAAGAQDTADGKIVTYYQNTAPTGSLGDLWFDTDDGNKLYRHDGTSFVAAQDAGIAQAISDAAGAQATADGKVTTFYQDATPTAEGVGDLWIDTNDNNKLYRWNGSTWQDSRDLGIAQAISAAATAQATADGKIETYYQTTMPTGVEGDLWFDTDDGNKLYRHNGTTFVVAQDAAIGQAITAAAGAQATADGKVTTFYTASTPTATAVGDLWYNTSNSLLRRWDGTNWLTVSNNYTNTNQLTDGAGLGTTAVWNNVSGTGKPQDNATRNVNRGAWATSIAYVVGDIVSRNGSSYSCILAHTSSAANGPPNATYWALLAQSGSTPTRSPVTVQITAIGTSSTIGVGLAISEAVDAQAYLNYINLNGGATCTIKIQYSTDGTTWTDLTGTTSAAGTVGEPINIDEFGTYTNSSGSPLYVQFRAVTTKTGAGTGTVSGSFLRA
jgi:ribosomal protein L27